MRNAMSSFVILKRRLAKFLLNGTAFGLVALAGGVDAADKKQMVVTAFEDVKFVPVDPARPDTQMAVLWGDPGKGPSALLLKFKKGQGRLHFHSADYHLVLLQGTMKHWAEGEQEADAKLLRPGSYWFQPGNEAHADSCLSDECLMFIKWEGKRDSIPAERPKE
jgi:quercetin dioxygenase-like cupin family protein